MTPARNVLPLIILLLTSGIPSGSFAQNPVTYRGNKFEMWDRIDTITLTDPVTNTEVQKVISDISIPTYILGHGTNNAAKTYW